MLGPEETEALSGLAAIQECVCVGGRGGGGGGVCNRQVRYSVRELVLV